MPTDTDALDAAWSSFSDRVKAAGESITGMTDDPRLRAEGYRYVGRLTNLAHQIYLEFGDPLVPMLFRYGDDVNGMKLHAHRFYSVSHFDDRTLTLDVSTSDFVGGRDEERADKVFTWDIRANRPR